MPLSVGLKKGFHVEISLVTYHEGLRLGSAALCLLGFGFEPPGNECLAVVSVVCCQVGVSASGWASRTESGVPECDSEACIMRRSWPTGHYGAMYRGADKSLARPTSQCILFDGENILFVASLVIYIYILLIFLQL